MIWRKMGGGMVETGLNDVFRVVWALGMVFFLILAYSFIVTDISYVGICSKRRIT